MKHNKQACRVIGCGTCDTTASEILRDFGLNNCKLCNKKTETVFNINWKPLYVCESCAMSITKQQVHSL